MTVQLSVALRSARANQAQTVTSTTAILRILSGSMPANCAAAETGTKLAEINPLPDPYLTTSADGTIAKSGTWSDASADASGTAGYWRLYKADGTTCTMQGDITATGGGGSMTLSSLSITAGVPFSVTSFGWTEADA